MNITIYPHKLRGTLQAIPAKSQAHRLLICAAFADRETTLLCPETNQDIEATAGCLSALGATIQRTPSGYQVTPIKNAPVEAVLDCKESGSTLRFLLPIVGALGVNGTFLLAGRLPQRPLSPLWEEMERMGCKLSRPTKNSILCTGKLHSGEYTIDGGISSQFITGLLFAAALMEGDSSLIITGKLESLPYIQMTQQALALFHVDTQEYRIKGNQSFSSPGTVLVEGDWSNGAFFLAANALGSNIDISNLDPNSCQGDRAAAVLIPQLKNYCTISAANIPDLVPILCIIAAANQGAVFTDIARLRLKESDRVNSVIAMLNSLGITAQATENTLTVQPGTFHGGHVDSFSDHRIAMAAAIAATIANGPVSIKNANCVAKSYPIFWDEYTRLGGIYE